MIRLIVACTDRKSVNPAAQMRAIQAQDVSARARAWTRLLHAHEATTPALDLYQGDHWAVARSIDRAELWVASAGYGLVQVTTPMVSYSATFAPGHADTVTTQTDRRKLSEGRQAWWSALRSQAELRTIKELSDDGATTVVAASAPYLDALTPELLEVERAGRRVILATASAIPRPIAHLRPPATGQLRTALGGSMQSVNIRLAKHLIERFDPETLSLASATAEVQNLLDRATPLERFDRSQVTDEWLIEFIAHRRDRDPKASHSRLLRDLRDGGHACEQSRFRRLFERVVEEE